jgi:hypothetical protein
VTGFAALSSRLKLDSCIIYHRNRTVRQNDQEQLTNWAVHGGKHNKSAKRQPTERATGAHKSKELGSPIRNSSKQQETLSYKQQATKGNVRNRKERQRITTRNSPRQGITARNSRTKSNTKGIHEQKRNSKPRRRRLLSLFNCLSVASCLRR